MNSKSIKETYRQAYTTYVDQEKMREETIGIIVSGSVMHANIDKNSDIDIYVILDPACTYRERGNTWINGVEVEYFKNPPAQVRSYFRKESRSPHTAHILAHGKVLYKLSSVVDELITEASEIWSKKPDEMGESQLELTKYQIDDLYKDLEDAIINEEQMGIELIRYKMIDVCIETFCKAHRIWRTKDKRLRQQLEKINPEFVTLIQAAIDPDWRDHGAIEKLRSGTEKLLGGGRTKEWKLRSALDI